MEFALHRWCCLLRRQQAPPAWHTFDLRSAGDRVACYCISLLSDSACEGRRQFFLKYARKHGWQIDFWPAVDGRALSVDQYPDWVAAGGRRLVTQQHLAGSEIGLLWSTRNLLQEATRQDLDYLFVFEDDAVIIAPPRLSLPPVFDIVFFNGGISAHPDGRVTGGWGTFGYVLSRTGIHKSLRLLEQANEPTDFLFLANIEATQQYRQRPSQTQSEAPVLSGFYSGPLVFHGEVFDSTLRA